jgi:hypothetical protein
MKKSLMRFVPFTVRQDPETEPTYEARCVSGDDKECGQASGEWVNPEPVDAWLDAHIKETGHRHYRRSFHDNAVYEPSDGTPIDSGKGLPAELEPARVRQA